MTTRIGFGRTLDLPFDQAIERVTATLAAEGFGVLSDVDVSATLKKKLGVDTPACRILGACNPRLAHQALALEPQIGLLLPCNVVVRDEAGAARVEFMDPQAVLGLVERPEVAQVAGEVRARLQRACDAL